MTQLALQPAPVDAAPRQGVRGIELRVIVGRAALGAHAHDGQVHPNDEMELVIRCRLFEGAQASIDIESESALTVPAVRAIRNANAEVTRVDGLIHIDVDSAAGERLVSLSLETGGKVVYARVPLLRTLGIPGGRYDPPTVVMNERAGAVV